MAKSAVGINGSVFGSASSAGLPAIFGQAIPVVVMFTPHQNPDHTPVKDTRT